MKFLASVGVYLLMALILAWGILLMMAGKPILLIVALLAYIIAVGRLGCMSH